MNHLGVLCLSLSLIAAAPAPSAVPVDEEPRHRLTFSNQYVRVFHVLIPPGDTTLFHTHVHDGLSVRLANARVRDESPGGTPEDTSVQRGAVTFSYRPGPLTHRVSSIGGTAFRNIFVEILPSAGSMEGTSAGALAAGRTLLLENERVRLTRLVLAAGQSVESLQALRGLRVAVSQGTITQEVAGEKARTVRYEPGDTTWHEGGEKHTVQNAGSAPFEAVEIELK